MTARRLQDELTQAKLARLSVLVARLTGLHFPEGRLDDLRRGIASAARDFGFSDANSFATWLLSTTLTGDQVLLLASHLTVGETYFFRDKSSFEVLSRGILPEIIRRRGTDRRLRIWSAGCATGEEPYSIAIALGAALPDAAAWDVRLLATDISPRSLKKAAEGVYGRWAFRDCPPHIKGAFFKEIKKGRFEISAWIKNMVTFAPLNLAEGSFPTPLEGAGTMDVIFCRNVLMYLTEDAAKKAVEVFNACLADSGWLVISAAEASPIIRNRFSPMSYPHCDVYRKSGKPQPPPTAFEAAPEATHIVTPDTPEVGEPAVSHPPEIATPPSESISPAAIYGHAEEMFNRGRCADAEEYLRRLLGKDPADARAMMLLARILANRGETEAALSWSRKGLAEDKLNPAYHYLLASVLSEHGQFEEAGASLRRALYLDNRFALAHFALGNLARRQGKTGESRRHLNNALALLSKRPPEEVLPESEGMTAGRLAEVVGSCLRQLP